MALSAQLQELQVCLTEGQISEDEHGMLRARLFDAFCARASRDHSAAEGTVPLLSTNERRGPGNYIECDPVDLRSAAEFWMDCVKKSRQASDTSQQKKLHPDQATVNDLCDLTAERVDDLFWRCDADSDGHITYRELAAGLTHHGFKVEYDQAVSIAEHVARRRAVENVSTNAAEGMISIRDFEVMLKQLRLAELFTPDAGLYRYNVDHELSVCVLEICDYNATECRPLRVVDDHKAFFFGSRPPLSKAPAVTNPAAICGSVGGAGGGGASQRHQFRHKTGGAQKLPVRWLHVDGTRKVDRLTLLRLAVKYHLHPLAVDDVFDPKTQTKVDRYADSFFVAVEIIALHPKSRPNSINRAAPPRVRTHRSHVSIFLTAPPDFDTVLTIHQERDDESSWLALWRKDNFDDSGKQSGHVPFNLWTQLAQDIEKEPIRRVREEAGDFLLYEVLQRVVAELEPVLLAYAQRLGYLRQQQGLRHLTQEWLDELGEVQLELADMRRSLRPLRQVVRHFKDPAPQDQIVGDACKMYLEDVDDSIDAMHEDVEQLAMMARSLEEAHQKFTDKRMNDTLFGLSVISAIFLPAQFFTGLYGMNFEDEDGDPGIPELKFKHGYVYFWAVQFVCFVTSIAVVTLLNKGGWRYLCGVRLCRRRSRCCCSETGDGLEPHTKTEFQE